MAPSMLDVLESGARFGGSLTLVTRSGEESRSYLELIEEARSLGVGLRNQGISTGTRVGLLAVPTTDFVVGLLATIEAGGCAVLLPPSHGIGRIERIGSLLEIASVDVTVGPSMPNAGGHHVELSPDDVVGRVEPSLEDGDGMILFTSGTTGDPRGVVLSHERMVRRVAADAALHDCDPQDDLFLSWRDLSTSGGIFLGLLVPMASGASLCVMGTDLFTRAPERWLIEISTRRATISAGPNFAYGVAAQRLSAGISERLDLSCWRQAYCVGERIDAAAVERFVRLAAPLGFEPTSFATRYAMTETGIVSMSAPRTGLRTDETDVQSLGRGHAAPARSGRPSARVVSSGSIRNEASVDIVDRVGESLDNRLVGEVIVRTPWLAERYLDNADETKNRFRDGWFYTGDLGYIADDALYITGRTKNVIIVGGRNYSGDDLERALQGIEGIAPSSVAVLGRPSHSTEEIVVFAETDADEDQRPRIMVAVRRQLWSDFALTVKEVVLTSPGSLPRTGVGKLRREALRATLVDGETSGV